MSSVKREIGDGIEEASHLDKPNLHRLLEPTMHTDPSFVHVRHASDLVFAHKCQSLKRVY